MRQGTISYRGFAHGDNEPHEKWKEVMSGVRGSFDIDRDLRLMDRTVEFFYASKRMDYVYVNDMFPPWTLKWLVCRLFGIGIRPANNEKL